MNLFESDFWYYIRRRIDIVRYALRNMIFRGHNNVRLTKFRGKDWVETDERLFESIFELLREYIEEQVAWLEAISDRDKYNWWIRFRMRYVPNRFRRELSRTLAIKHLDWEISSTLFPQQAESAQKQKDLYLWYLDVYNKYVNPFEDIGVDAPGEILDFKQDPDDPNLRIMDFHDDDSEWAEYNAALAAAGEEDRRRYEEATEKAIEVLKIRQSLWT